MEARHRFWSFSEKASHGNFFPKHSVFKHSLKGPTAKVETVTAEIDETETTQAGTKAQTSRKVRHCSSSGPRVCLTQACGRAGGISVVKSTCSYRGPCFQDPHGSSRLSITPAQKDLAHSSAHHSRMESVHTGLDPILSSPASISFRHLLSGSCQDGPCCIILQHPQRRPVPRWTLQGA